jgi:hypothetical protein
VGGPEPEHVPRRGLDPLLGRHRRPLEILGVGKRHLGHTDALDRRVEVVEAPFRMRAASSALTP